MTLLDRFTAHLLTLGVPRGPVLVAVSGGPDSVALLDLLVASAPAHGLSLRVAHVDHGIHPESGDVASLVEGLAQGYGLPFHHARLRLGPAASETTARTQRYAWIETIRADTGASRVLVAHHADDQVETILMRVLRGSGPAGMAGMAVRHGSIVRPLLPFRREELVQYVLDRGLPHWEDPANRDPRHLRSWIREVALPMLQERVPDVDLRLLAAARQAALQRRAWDALLDTLPGLDLRRDSGGISVAAPVLAGYDSALAMALLGAVVRRAGGTLGIRHRRAVVRFLRSAASGATYELPGGWRLERAFDRIRVVAAAAADSDARSAASADLSQPEGSLRWGDWTVGWRRDSAPAVQPRDGMTAWFTPEPVLVRRWRAGDRVAPLGGVGHRLAVRCFQDARIPRSRRAAWPVLDQAGLILWIPGVCRSAVQLPVAGAPAVRVDVAAV